MVSRILVFIVPRIYFFIKHIVAKILIFYKFSFRGFSGVKFIGARAIIIGYNTCIGQGSWLNVNKPDSSELIIGNNSFVGMNNFLSVGKRIVIGDYFLSGANCSFIGSSHVIQDVRKPYLKTGTTSNNEILIGDNVFLGYNVSLVGNVSVGKCSIVGANSVVLMDIPNYAIAIGNPARVVKRFDFGKGTWEKSSDMTDYEDVEVVLEKKFFMPIAAAKKYMCTW